MDVDLEHGRMIPGFIEGVIGMKVGDSKTVDCQFPDDYPKEDARGRKAAFAIDLKDLKTRELPELNDEFAKQASEQETLWHFQSTSIFRPLKKSSDPEEGHLLEPVDITYSFENSSINMSKL